jgi:hypothetical protein
MWYPAVAHLLRFPCRTVPARLCCVRVRCFVVTNSRAYCVYDCSYATAFFLIPVLTFFFSPRCAVPALCISWIDASLLAKDGMYKTTRGVTKEMYFTDDGFPVGIAYCLAILKQVGDVIVMFAVVCGGSCLL